MLTGNVALVTGGASGIGLACAQRLAEMGAWVVIADRSRAAAESAATTIGAKAVAVAGDVRSERDCLAMVDAALGRFGKLDVAVNNAGIPNPNKSRVADITWAEWRDLLDVNLDGVFLSMKAEIPAMLLGGGGHIINIASVMGTVATFGAAAYVAAKHGVVGLTKAAALDYGAAGIRVNAVGPGYVDTPMLARRTPEQIAEIAGRHALNRLAAPEEIAAMVGFLASPHSSFLTGAFLPVDGGYTAR